MCVCFQCCTRAFVICSTKTDATGNHSLDDISVNMQNNKQDLKKGTQKNKVSCTIQHVVNGKFSGETTLRTTPDRTGVLSICQRMFSLHKTTVDINCPVCMSNMPYIDENTKTNYCCQDSEHFLNQKDGHLIFNQINNKTCVYINMM